MAAPTIPARSCQHPLGPAEIPPTYVEHARNFGQHSAVMTGLRHASRAYVTMDDDLQNLPKAVIRLYDQARLGNWDVVYTHYASKQRAGWRNLGRRFANAGWASTMTVILLVAGVQSMILGVLGEYVGRTFLSANGKPQGTVRSVEHSAAAARSEV
jgi:hypothetical protein